MLYAWHLSEDIFRAIPQTHLIIHYFSIFCVDLKRTEFTLLASKLLENCYLCYFRLLQFYSKVKLLYYQDQSKHPAQIVRSVKAKSKLCQKLFSSIDISYFRWIFCRLKNWCLSGHKYLVLVCLTVNLKSKSKSYV